MNLSKGNYTSSIIVAMDVDRRGVLFYQTRFVIIIGISFLYSSVLTSHVF